MMITPPGLGSLLDVNEISRTSATESQLKSLREAAPAFGQKVVRKTEEARALYNSASTPEQQKLKDTADEFVSILYSMLFKQMDATVPKSGFLDGGKAEEMFKSMIINDYAKTASSQGQNPLAHRIYEMLYDSTAARRPEQLAAEPIPSAES